MLYDEQQNLIISYKVTHNDKELAERLKWFKEQKGIKLIPFQVNQDPSLPLLKITRKGAFLATNQDQFFFHPSMALLRIMHIIKGETDRFLQAAGLAEGDSIIDATMGLASDSLVAAWAVGEKGTVIALENSPVIYALVTDGLHSLQNNYYNIGSSNQEKIKAWQELSRASRIIVPHLVNHLDYLADLPNAFVDVIYFDPMFKRSRKESSSIKPLKTWSYERTIQAETIAEAYRIAKKRVVLKERKNSGEFARLGFKKVPSGKYSSIDFGYIDI